MPETNSANSQMLSIEIGNANSPRYKSIDRIEWQDIPPFAVLTGLNGSGKTQLLQILAYRLSNTLFQQDQKLNAVPVQIKGVDIGPHEVSYMPSEENRFRVQHINISNLFQAKQQFLQNLSPQHVAHNIEAKILSERVQRKFGIRIHSNQVDQRTIEMLPDDFMFMLEYGDVSAALSHIFFGYQIRFAEKLLEQKDQELIIEELGRAPWDFVNEALSAADFSYRVVPPKNKLLKNYKVMVAAVGSDDVLDLNDLSSGEQIILRTILWLYNSKHNNVFPKLFLLDEPDAHLHPSMTRQFIDVLKNVLVDQYGVRVILTTHSPSTVALAPEESLYVMSRDQPRIRKPSSKAEAIGLLTSGLVIVSPGTRFVLVEDESDVSFYNMVRDILADQGPSKDRLALKPAPSLVFMPASAGSRATKVGGGKDAVRQWVDKFDTPPLREMFHGIIDLDRGNTASTRVHVLNRYSFENYLVDPFVVLGVLIEDARTPAQLSLQISPGDEHLIRSLSTVVLQSVVDYIAEQVEPELGALNNDERLVSPVSFTSGISLGYPNWMLTRRGHDLVSIYQTIFGQNTITPPRLKKSFRRIRLVPLELAQIMSDLQNS